jgi:hypothetical protein
VFGEGPVQLWICDCKIDAPEYRRVMTVQLLFCSIDSLDLLSLSENCYVFNIDGVCYPTIASVKYFLMYFLVLCQSKPVLKCLYENLWVFYTGDEEEKNTHVILWAHSISRHNQHPKPRWLTTIVDFNSLIIVWTYSKLCHICRFYRGQKEEESRI